MKINFKSLFATLALGSILGVGAYAQEVEATDNASSGGGAGMELTFGIEAGGTWSSFARNGNSFTDKQVGYAIGAFAQSQLMGPLGFSVGIMYAQQGAADVQPDYIQLNELVNNNPIFTIDTDVKAHKVNVPILLRLSPSDMPGAGDVKPVAYAGIDLGYLISAQARDYKFVNNNPDIILGNSQAVDVTNNFNSFDYGLMVGTGISFEGEDRGYGIDVKYRMGINNINNNQIYYLSNFYNQNSLLVTLKVGL